MKIAIAVNTLSFGSGIPNVAISTANAFVKLGARVWFLTLRGGRREDLAGEIPVVALYPRARGAHRVFSSGWLSPAANVLAKRALDPIRPDVVVVHYPPLDRCFAREGRGYKLVYFCHNVTDPVLYAGSERTRREGEAARIFSLLPRCDAVVANSAFTARAVKDRSGVDAHVIHPGVDLAKYRPSGPAASRFVLSVGRIVPHKGVREMIQAFGLIRKGFPPAKLRLIGRQEGDAYYAEVMALAAACEGVELMGQMPESAVIRELQNAAVFASCSRFEGFGIPFVEAAACGVPSVGFRAAGIPEALADGESGFLVEPGDLQALADAVVRLLSDVPLRRRISGQAAAWAQRFSWESRAQMHLELYERLLKGRS